MYSIPGYVVYASMYVLLCAVPVQYPARGTPAEQCLAYNISCLAFALQEMVNVLKANPKVVHACTYV